MKTRIGKLINLKTLAQATAQEVFDQVAAHLSSGSMMCAAGCLIADQEYSRSMEGHNWLNLVEKGIVPSHHSLLISRLQRLHDEAYVQNWIVGLKGIAEEFSLEF